MDCLKCVVMVLCRDQSLFACCFTKQAFALSALTWRQDRKKEMSWGETLMWWRYSRRQGFLVSRVLQERSLQRIYFCMSKWNQESLGLSPMFCFVLKCSVSIWFSRVIWLGDLNYRIALSYRSAKALVEMQNWRALLENDQLRIEQKRGHVFKGWDEGKIYFPPTYKYSNNSDRYAGDDLHPKEKRRTPAWLVFL